jgi:uncharacterized membrane protein
MKPFGPPGNYIRDPASNFTLRPLLRKTPMEKLKVQEITKEGHGGTAVGAFIGALAGLPAGPAASAIMAAGGAVIGNAVDLIAQDDFKEFANNIADNVVPGGAAIVADVAEDNLVAFKAMMQAVGGGVLTSPCSNPQTNTPVVKET